MRLDHLLSRETLIVSDGVERKRSPAWKTNNNLFWVPNARIRLASSPARSASGFRGSAPEGALSGPPRTLTVA